MRQLPTPFPAFYVNAAFAVALVLGACSDDSESGEASGALVRDGTVALSVVIPEDAIAGLAGAAEDLVVAVETITGAAVPDDAVRTSGASTPRVEVSIVDGLGDEAYTLLSSEGNVTVTSSTQEGAMYGIYHLIGDLGVRYHHPEETWFPTADQLVLSGQSAADLQLPTGYDGADNSPDFEWRGFHEHTQHPIVMSDFLLRPEAEFRPYLSRYIRWLARNRQNTMSWQMLKTVELDAWLPYMDGVVDEAHEWGVRVGMVTSFVDQQQNMFRLIRAEEGDGEPVDEEEQIRDGLAELLTVDFDFLVSQIGSSEFTKPADEDVLRWIDLASDILGEAGVRYWTWIHTTCDLEADDGSHFYHLPLQADENVGAWLHTTMFHNLRDPAPVYSCEDFSHQRSFGDEANGERSIVYFPETAWWLGFDNNMPLILPLTGVSRETDLRDVLPAWDVEGHVTFTSGREWTYWQYDHFLTQATWDRDVTWSAYLEWIQPMYGTNGGDAISVLQEWTQNQERDFFDEDPLLYFYLAGELRQDEIGAQAGILARRPKLAFADVVAMDDDTYAAWRQGDFAALQSMRESYNQAFIRMAAPDRNSDELSQVLYSELVDALYVYVRRIDHVLTLYGALDHVRSWSLESEEADDARRDELLAAAEAGLADASAISDEMLGIFEAAEDRYRYPVELLAREKPETPTAYPFGYIWQVSTGHFWTRRDDQLDSLIGLVFGTAQDEWADAVPEVLLISDSTNTTLLEPDHPLASSVITGFIPQTLFGIDSVDDEPVLSVALDFNENLLPDPGTETVFLTQSVAEGLVGSAEAFTLNVYSAAGEQYGAVNVLDAVLSVDWSDGSASQAELSGMVPSEEMVGLIVAVGGIDSEGAANLLKSVFGVAAEEPMPAMLPIRFGFDLRLP